VDWGRQTLVRSFTLPGPQLAENPFVAGTAFTESLSIRDSLHRATL
jgi:hypothetical protein